MSVDELTFGAQVSAYLRASVTLARETARVGPFLASFSISDSNRFANYAIPDDGATPTLAQVVALADAYRGRDRLPRLEYVPAVAPGVESALLAAGWQVEGRLPLMLLPPAIDLDGTVPAGVELMAPITDGELLATAAVQNEAYGEGPPGPGGGDGLRRTIKNGGHVVLARLAGGGEAIGGGLFPSPQDGVTEIAAIGVREPFRRRGVASAMVRWLAREAQAAGAETVFLMAESEVEERIYARIGFEAVGEMLHISSPASSDRSQPAAEG